MQFTRRDLGKLALAALPAASLSAKPNSLFAGVQIGCNVPYSFRGLSGTADKILEYMNQINCSGAELRLQPVEAYFDAPGVYASNADAPGGGRGGPWGRSWPRANTHARATGGSG
ncbi:MAG TPA: hypothetical protein VFC21_08665 [Bryobacteraceae bacterium]|nr:hypothetical protein [Bryobacteraceae bacterium]